jgi:hypothetical protein
MVLYLVKSFFFFILLLFSSQVSAQDFGCTDPLANNFNAAATINNGTCTYNPAATSSVRSWNLPTAIDETSGLVFWNNRIWTHNDDTDIHLYELNLDNINTFQKFELVGTRNIDWEEIAQDEQYIYVGDFGNNARGNRTNLYILRIEKNSLLEGNPIIDSILFSYALQTNFSPSEPNKTDFDCEAFLVSKDSIYLFTKEWVSQKTSVYSLPKTPGNYVAKFKNTLNIEGMITGATYLEEKRLIVLSGYNLLVQPFVFLLYDFKNYDFFSGNKRKIAVNHPFHQMEGITTEDGLIYYISNERLSVPPITINQKLQRFNLTPFLRNYLNSLCDLPAEAGIITGDTVVCQGVKAVNYSTTEIAGATSYVWSLPDGIEGFSTSNSILLNFGENAISGDISVRGKNDCGVGTSFSLPILVKTLPNKPIISFADNILISNALEGNQWYNETGLIEGATNQEFVATESGTYYVIVTIEDCVSEPSDEILYTVTNTIEGTLGGFIKVYPNPTFDFLTIEQTGEFDTIHFEIQNALGQVVYKGKMKDKTVVETSNLESGVYLIKFQVNGRIHFKKILKQ